MHYIVYKHALYDQHCTCTTHLNINLKRISRQIHCLWFNEYHHNSIWQEIEAQLIVRFGNKYSAFQKICSHCMHGQWCLVLTLLDKNNHPLGLDSNFVSSPLEILGQIPSFYTKYNTCTFDDAQWLLWNLFPADWLGYPLHALTGNCIIHKHN